MPVFVAALVSPWLAVSPTRQDASSMQPIDLLSPPPLTGGAAAWAEQVLIETKAAMAAGMLSNASEGIGNASTSFVSTGADVDEWSSVNESTVFNSTVSGAVILKSMVQGNSHISGGSVLVNAVVINSTVRHSVLVNSSLVNEVMDGSNSGDKELVTAAKEAHMAKAMAAARAFEAKHVTDAANETAAEPAANATNATATELVVNTTETEPVASTEAAAPDAAAQGAAQGAGQQTSQQTSQQKLTTGWSNTLS